MNYKSLLNKIRELKQARNPELFAKEIQRMSKQINQRFYRLEKAGYEGDTAYRYAQKETGKNKPRYSVSLNKIMGMSLEEMYQTAIEINAKLISPTSTIRGIKELENRRLESSSQALEELGINLSPQEIKELVTNGGGELLGNKWLDSYQIVDDWEFAKERGLTVKEFIRSYKAEIKKQSKSRKEIDVEFDYGYLRQRVKGIGARKKARRESRKARKK